MASKKDFKKSPAEMFISAAEEPEAPIEAPAEENIVIPKGYRLAPEIKNARLQLLLKPSTKESLKALAHSKCMSMNELINMILEDYIERG